MPNISVVNRHFITQIHINEGVGSKRQRSTWKEPPVDREQFEPQNTVLLYNSKDKTSAHKSLWKWLDKPMGEKTLHSHAEFHDTPLHSTHLPRRLLMIIFQRALHREQEGKEWLYNKKPEKQSLSQVINRNSDKSLWHYVPLMWCDTMTPYGLILQSHLNSSLILERKKKILQDGHSATFQNCDNDQKESMSRGHGQEEPKETWGLNGRWYPGCDAGTEKGH